MNGPDPAAYFADARPVTLEEMLEAREARAVTQRRLLEYGSALISFTQNIPGEYKRYPLVERSFWEGMARIGEELDRRNLPLLHREERISHTGCEGFWAVDAPPAEVKRLMADLEDSHPLGRLWDMDVLAPDGSILHGEELGRPERTCLICGGPVWACSRSRTHSAGDLALRAVQIMEDFFGF